jgi:hypothetical protein
MWRTTVASEGGGRSAAGEGEGHGGGRSAAGDGVGLDTLLTDASLGTGRRWFPGRAGAELALPGRPPTG